MLGQPAAAAGSWPEEPLPQLQEQGSLHTAAGDGPAWSFGITLDGSNEHHSLAFRQGREGWEQVQPPDIGRIDGATVVSRDDVWTVGDGKSMHWDGRAWTEVPLAAPPNTYTQYFGTKAFGPDDVRTAGIATENGNDDAGNIQPYAAT
ncbi:hypothetical protein AB0I53_32405 [Saccharopolyspora sp. NPDC050389]|uniref:hypothetical protein n=1 Tax=Saccharopolyspora sp. NPDC050389 TaxID=3155516 RepID=UPI0033C9CF28